MYTLITANLFSALTSWAETSNFKNRNGEENSWIKAKKPSIIRQDKKTLTYVVT